MTRVQAIVEEMRLPRAGGAVLVGNHKQNRNLDRLLAAHRADLEEASGEPTDDEFNGAKVAIHERWVAHQVLASRRKRYIP